MLVSSNVHVVLILISIGACQYIGVDVVAIVVRTVLYMYLVVEAIRINRASI